VIRTLSSRIDRSVYRAGRSRTSRRGSAYYREPRLMEVRFGEPATYPPQERRPRIFFPVKNATDLNR